MYHPDPSSSLAMFVTVSGTISIFNDLRQKDLQQLLRAERSKTGALTLQLATAHKATEDRTKDSGVEH